MSSQTLNAELMRILKFDSSDLDANRQGQMSIGQRTRLLLENNEVVIILLCLVGAPIGIVGMIAREGIKIDQILAALAVIVLAVIFGRPYLKKLWEVLLGKVSVVSGTITIRLQPYDPRYHFVAAVLGDKWAYGVIEDISFQVPLEMETTFQGKKLAVYYTPQSRKVLAALVIE